MDKEKHIDEGWKESVAKEKDTQQDAGKLEKEGTGHQNTDTLSSDGSYEVNFLGYVTSLAYQAVIFMGRAPNPIDNRIEANLPQAKLLIDTLSMLKDKTQGNLNEQEANALTQLLYELQMAYVETLNQKEQK